MRNEFLNANLQHLTASQSSRLLNFIIGSLHKKKAIFSDSLQIKFEYNNYLIAIFT